MVVVIVKCYDLDLISVLKLEYRIFCVLSGVMFYRWFKLMIVDLIFYGIRGVFEIFVKGLLFFVRILFLGIIFSIFIDFLDFNMVGFILN